MSLKKINKEVLNWYAKCDNKGISSETMANTAVAGKLTGTGGWRPLPPSDNSDFGRCVLFKIFCPTAFKMAKKILKDEPEWDEYFKHWNKMEKLLEEQQEKKRDGMELYNFMQDVQDKARNRKD